MSVSASWNASFSVQCYLAVMAQMWQVQSTFSDDCWLLIAFGVSFCVCATVDWMSGTVTRVLSALAGMVVSEKMPLNECCIL